MGRKSDAPGGENANLVLAFFAPQRFRQPATAWPGSPKLMRPAAADDDALEAARSAWASSDLGRDDEQAIWARYGGTFTRADHDRRIDALIVRQKRRMTPPAYLAMACPARQAAFAARIAIRKMSRRCREAVSRR